MRRIKIFCYLDESERHRFDITKEPIEVSEEVYWALQSYELMPDCQYSISTEEVADSSSVPILAHVLERATSLAEKRKKEAEDRKEKEEQEKASRKANKEKRDLAALARLKAKYEAR